MKGILSELMWRLQQMFSLTSRRSELNIIAIFFVMIFILMCVSILTKFIQIHSCLKQ